MSESVPRSGCASGEGHSFGYYIHVITRIELSFLANFLALSYTCARSGERVILAFAEFVSLSNGQQLNRLQKIVCCILDYKLHIMTITGV